ncbi:hypothetical protein FBEOM_2507 [Fusarium beomiforme]|uniref:Uncharacterized protein n=1 Tax=Fusarium beomiforme TaxID=44412 RepID=A0A9P5ATL5_9HYPO|nr:hypothetical protein FBEOM_2507 [Fusarium beomiforme]
MASSPVSPSRLKLDIQSFDQVIALSQAHINQTLKYNFTFTNQKLLKFDKEFNGTSLYGDLKPPSIGIIRSDQEEQALLFLDFKNGEFIWTEIELVVGENGRKRSKSTDKDIPATGWRLAFLVKFSLQEVENSELPDQVAAVTSDLGKPGDYSISRLILDFGNAKHLSLEWEQCLTPGLEGEARDKMKPHIEIFTRGFLSDLTKVDEDNPEKFNANILGYAVKVDSTPKVLEQANKNAPHLSPTALRLQTMVAKGETPNPSGDLNAILFTEMTEGRPLPKDRLPWTGDLFYQSIGGTLAVAKSNFWDKFIKPKLQVVNKDNMDLMNEAAWLFCDQSRFSSDKAGPTSHVWVVQPKDKGSFETVDLTFNKESGTRWHEDFENMTVRNESFLGGRLEDKWTCTSYCRNDVEPISGTGRIVMESDVYINSVRQVSGYTASLPFVGELPLAIAFIYATTRMRWTTTLTLRSIETGGGLEVEVSVKRSDPENTFQTVTHGAFDDVPFLKSFTEDLKASLKDASDKIPGLLSRYLDAFVAAQNTAEQLSKALNGQSRFIFPGGGTFDMKDPIFSTNKDVLIGLSYRQGKAKSA